MKARHESYDYLIIGCGLTGATLAERIANVLDASVLVIDRRDHIGGLCYDELDDHGILAGKYGAHIFHTASDRVWKYVSHFTAFNAYIHRVDAYHDGHFYAMPLGLDAINSFFGSRLNEEQLPAFLEQLSEHIPHPRNAEEVMVSTVGWELYEAFFQNYIRKMWATDPRDLDPAAVMHVPPVRLTGYTPYFLDPWQGVPLEGYTTMFERMLDHKNIRICLNTDYRQAASAVAWRYLVFTGSIDAYFDHVFGRLPYRSVDFRFETKACDRMQHRGVLMYPNDHEYMRSAEFKWIYQQQHEKTTICRYVPVWNDDEPCYPVPCPANRALYLKYKDRGDGLRNTYFCGRLGTYADLTMGESVAHALALFERRIAPDARAGLARVTMSVPYTLE
ncbi:MAG TPA: UDP-galactopyranose mutase [Nitrospirota bacterium]|nr:UDP-galactopyranose mutase [Nitrospirota bacterium]